MPRKPVRPARDTTTSRTHPAEIWLNPLADLLATWHKVDYAGWDGFVFEAARSLRQEKEYQLVYWLRRGAPAPSLTPEGETAAARGILRALGYVYDDPARSVTLSPDQRQKLHDLRCKVAQAIQKWLNVRDGNQPRRRTHIDPKHRTRPMSIRGAAWLMGYGKSRAATKRLRAAIDVGAVRCEHHTRKQHVFSLEDFPKASHAAIRPDSP